MGLHRDGELLGLKPFETEMRRRLWWQIIMLDSKYAILSGLSHTLLPRGWDTREPKNISAAPGGPIMRMMLFGSRHKTCSRPVGSG